MDAEALAASMFVPHSNPRVEAGRLVRAIQVCHHVIRIFDKRQSVLAADNDFAVVEPAMVSARVVPPRRKKVKARRGMPPPDPPTVEQVESALSLSSKSGGEVPVHDPPTVKQAESARAMSSKAAAEPPVKDKVIDDDESWGDWESASKNETAAAIDDSRWSRHASPDHKKQDAKDDWSSWEAAKATKKAKSRPQGATSYTMSKSSSRWSHT